MAKVSVIIPVYNAEKYLKECLDSVCAQTLLDIEIICVDDGSEDSSPEILNEYARKDTRFIILSQENSGAGAARNKGLCIAGGEYLSFLDADDFFDADMLEKTYEMAKACDADFTAFASDQFLTDENKFISKAWILNLKAMPSCESFNHRDISGNPFRAFMGWAWDKLYKKSFIEKNNLYFQEQRTSNDMYFVFAALVLAERICVTDRVLAHQRRDAKASLSKTRENSWQCFYNALIALRERLKNEGLFEELEREFTDYALHCCLWNVKTLAQPEKSLLIKKLKTGWENELGIKGKGPGYFYSRKDYFHYKLLVR